MADDLDSAFKDLSGDANARALVAFKLSLGNVEALAKQMCPIGHYRRGRGTGGQAGGNLQSTLRVEFLGQSGDELRARCFSPCVYARFQHERVLHHPGVYTGAAGPAYRAAFFERGVAIIFGDGNDPLGLYAGPVPAGFKELLES